VNPRLRSLRNMAIGAGISITLLIVMGAVVHLAIANGYSGLQ